MLLPTEPLPVSLLIPSLLTQGLSPSGHSSMWPSLIALTKERAFLFPLCLGAIARHLLDTCGCYRSHLLDTPPHATGESLKTGAVSAHPLSPDWLGTQEPVGVNLTVNSGGHVPECPHMSTWVLPGSAHPLPPGLFRLRSAGTQHIFLVLARSVQLCSLWLWGGDFPELQVVGLVMQTARLLLEGAVGTCQSAA